MTWCCDIILGIFEDMIFLLMQTSVQSDGILSTMGHI